MIPGEIDQAISGLGLAELCQLREMVDRLIQKQRSASSERPHPGRSGPRPGDVAQTKHQGPITYQLEWISCGKGCKGCPHGPYWYGYWREKGRTRSKYIGKTLHEAGLKGEAALQVSP